MIIFAAFLEEYVFRGVIFRILKERFGTNIALIHALIFGVIRYTNITSAYFVVMLGVVLSLIHTYTQRLWLPFFFHLI